MLRQQCLHNNVNNLYFIHNYIESGVDNDKILSHQCK